MAETQNLTDNEFMKNYRATLERYSDTDFEEFFKLSEINDPDKRALGKDFIGAAGSFYLSNLKRQSEQVRRSDTIKHLNKAKKASLALAENLSAALRDQSMIGALRDLTPSVRATFGTEQDQTKDSYQILDAVFPLSSHGKGFRYEGLAQALTMLASTLEAVEVEAIKKPDTGRSHALRPWMILMASYWVQATGQPPQAGYYDSEIADYTSAAVAALTQIAQRIDPEVSARLVVQAMTAATESYENGPLEAAILMSMSFLNLISSGEAYAPNATLQAAAGLPQAEFKEFSELTLTDPDPLQEKSIMTREEFSRTLESSNLGKMLLDPSIEKDDD